MQENATFSSVIKNPGFLNLWINQILVQLSYNSLNFALIIWVYRLTSSNTAVSALLFSVYLPAVIFGLFAGVLVDVTDRKRIILAIDLLLAICFFALIFLKDFYPAILLIAFLVNTLAQFYSPAEASAIPIVVKKKQLLMANSLFSITLYSAFLLGFGLAGPLITHLGINTVFALGGTLLSIAFFLALTFPSIINKADEQGQKLIQAITHRDIRSLQQVAFVEVKETLKLVRGKLSVLFSIVILSGVQMVIGVLAVLIPSFFESDLHISATDASYVIVIPLGLGMVLGGYLIGKFGNRFPKRTIVSRAILIAGLLFFLVGIAPMISPAIKYFPRVKPVPFFYQPPLSTIMAFGSFLLGMCMVSIIVPSQTVMQENTREQVRGKVFSVLGVAMAGMSLLPVLFAGVLADLFGAYPIFIAMGGIIALLGLFGLRPNFYFESNHLPLHIRQFLGLGHWEKSN